MTERAYRKYGLGKPDIEKTEFFSAKNDITDIINSSKGNLNKIAEGIGIPADQLKDGSLLRIDVNPTLNYSPSIPTGNEFGANSQWLPGGRLPTGKSEVIVPFKNMDKDVDYTIVNLVTGDTL